VLKLDRKTELLSPALEGLAAFAHLINIDFFKDLLAHLKALMSGQNLHAIQLDTRERLLCIVTAFQLLSGQGARVRGPSVFFADVVRNRAQARHSTLIWPTSWATSTAS
jgi:hypothetical protein